MTQAKPWVLLVHDRGYLQVGGKLGPAKTAMKFANVDSAVEAGIGWLKRKGKWKGWTVEAMKAETEER